MFQFRTVIIGTDDTERAIRKIKRILTIFACNEQTIAGQPLEGSLGTLRRSSVLQIRTEIKDTEDRDLLRSDEVI
jgi:Tfp pilus assembly pilus retraction ATPase PilT